MCDSILAMPSSTARRVTLFGKNSDRQRNEAQAVEYYPRAKHVPGTYVQCTYLKIPQVGRTHAVLLCRPFWAWGAEMGANEHGVAIGNEAVHARSAPSEEKELPGMDLVRLTLERATTADEAVAIMTALLERHGQGGNCGHLTPAFYNNGFLIADSNAGYVLETVGREWLVERVADVRAISNVYSIGKQPDRVSDGLHQMIREAGWSTEAAPDYAEVMSNPNREHIGFARARRARATSLLTQEQGQLDALAMMKILRDHGPIDPSGVHLHPADAAQISICMHAGTESRAGQTVGAMVSELAPSAAIHWITGTAAPCISIFKPVLIDSLLPDHGPPPTDRFDVRTLWWRHERLHRGALLADFNRFLDDVHYERDAIERDFRDRISVVLNGGSVDDRARVVAQCWRDALDTEERWYSRASALVDSNESAHYRAWTEMNRLAGFDAMELENRHARKN